MPAQFAACRYVGRPILAVLMGLRPTKWDESPPKYCGAGCQPAADWESACRHTQRIFNGLRWAFDRAPGFQPPPHTFGSSPPSAGRLLLRRKLKVLLLSVEPHLLHLRRRGPR